MKARNNISSKLLRVILALAGFVGAIFAVLYIGFAVKFQGLNLRQSKNIPVEDNGKTVFYQSIGKTHAELTHNSTTPAALQEKYTLELKVVSKRTEAEALVIDLGKQGVHAYFTPFQSKGRIFYRVRQGIYTSKATAEQQANQMKIAKQLPVTVVKLR